MVDINIDYRGLGDSTSAKFAQAGIKILQPQPLADLIRDMVKQRRKREAIAWVNAHLLHAARQCERLAKELDNG